MLIQRFGSALNLNVHAHMLFLDGVYARGKNGQLRFHRTAAPDIKALEALVHRISHRVGRCLERQGYLERDEENTYAVLDGLEDDECMQQLQSHSITYRIALGPNRGRKVMTLQTLPPDDEGFSGSGRVAKLAGFSLHAGVSKLRAEVTPAKKGKPINGTTASAQKESLSGEVKKRAGMTWAQRLKRVFNIDIEVCERCQGRVKEIASIEEPAVIEKILGHCRSKKPEMVGVLEPGTHLPGMRAPPEERQMNLFS